MSIVWAVVCYFVVKEVQKNNPQVQLNPWLYAGAAIIFGFLGTAGFLGYKVCDSKGNQKGKIFSILAMVLAVLINIIYIISMI